MPARCPAYIALAASWLSRWKPAGSSECMTGRPPACWFSAAFSWIPSIASSLNPHQSAHTETDVPSLASRSAILYDSTAWWNDRILKPNSCARSSICAISSARSEEHTSELQSQSNLVCRLLLEKKKKEQKIMTG